MSDRAAILRRLRSVADSSVKLPEVAAVADGREGWLAYSEPVKQFVTALESVGGRCVVAGAARLAAVVEELSSQVEAKSSRCAIAGLMPAWPSVASAGKGTVGELAGLDFLAVAGDLAVAENGAVWISDSAVADRAALFLAQHVAVVVPHDAVVDTMHDAYARVAIGATAFGVFVSGPSKTADIEQCLVIGAHGPRSWTVVLVR